MKNQIVNTKKTLVALLLTLLLMTAIAPAAWAGDIRVFVNDQQLNPDVPPQIVNDRVMIPMRMIFESLGAKVTWIEETQKIVAIRGGVIVGFQIGNTVAGKSDLALTKVTDLQMDVAPVIINDRTLVPVRFVAESLGATVEWNGVERAVYVSDKQSTTPSIPSDLANRIAKAIANKDINTLGQLLDQVDNVNSLTYNGKSFLTVAVGQLDSNIIRAILDHGANPYITIGGTQYIVREVGTAINVVNVNTGHVFIKC